MRRRLARPAAPRDARRCSELTSFASYTLNLDLTWAGIPRDAFGSVMITNVGTLGLEEAYVPLVPYSRVPLLLALGAIRETPVARDGRVEVARTMKLCATLDHRVLDGSHAAAMADLLRAWIEDPFAHFESDPGERAERAGAGRGERRSFADRAARGLGSAGPVIAPGDCTPFLEERHG